MGGMELEKRYGLDLWRSMAMISFLPVVNPPTEPPNAFPRVPVMISI